MRTTYKISVFDWDSQSLDSDEVLFISWSSSTHSLVLLSRGALNLKSETLALHCRLWGWVSLAFVVLSTCSSEPLLTISDLLVLISSSICHQLPGSFSPLICLWGLCVVSTSYLLPSECSSLHLIASSCSGHNCLETCCFILSVSKENSLSSCPWRRPLPDFFINVSADRFHLGQRG